MNTTVTSQATLQESVPAPLAGIATAVDALDRWIEESEWVGYDPFDGLSAPLGRRLTFENPLLHIVLQQSVRRFPLNLRPLLGITRKRSTKAMGYFAAGYLRLHQLTGRQEYLDKARFCFDDLQTHYSEGYSGYAWGNAFDYASRSMAFLPAGIPTVVWTSFIGWAFVDAFEYLGEQRYLDVARSACEFILRDLSRGQITPDSFCMSYFPHKHLEIHNANILGASLLARVYKHTREAELADVARQAVNYTVRAQHEDGAWWYGEGRRWRWVDGYHTGFVVDALYYYMLNTDDWAYRENLDRGMAYYRANLFEGVLPKHYTTSTYPIDIQVVAQAIQSFALLPPAHSGDLDWSQQVAEWGVAHMQDRDGHFYFRKHRRGTNRTAMLHWGQSTMLAALSLLLQRQAAAEAPAVLAQIQQPALAGVAGSDEG